MSKRILVIDDEELLIRTMNKLLEKAGYEVYTVKNGEDAIAIVEEEDFDLGICDIRMPGKNGIEVVQVIQNSLLTKKKKPFPIIFVTGFADENMEANAKKLSPVGYLFKPFDANELLSIVRSNI